MIAEENTMIHKAFGTLKKLSEDERTRLLYEEREKHRMDRQILLKDAYRKGLGSGKSEGVSIGLEKGRMEGRMEGISALIEDNMDEGTPKEGILQKIQKKFGVSEEEAEEHWRHITSGM